jgi:hypothetical protein
MCNLPTPNLGDLSLQNAIFPKVVFVRSHSTEMDVQTKPLDLRVIANGSNDVIRRVAQN